MRQGTPDQCCRLEQNQFTIRHGQPWQWASWVDSTVEAGMLCRLLHRKAQGREGLRSRGTHVLQNLIHSTLGSKVLHPYCSSWKCILKCCTLRGSPVTRGPS